MFGLALLSVTGGYAIGDERHGSLGLGILGFAVLLTAASGALLTQPVAPLSRIGPVLGLVALAGLSQFWSVSPEATTSAWVRIVLIVLAGLALGMCVSVDRQIATLVVCATVWALLAAALIFLDVAGAVDQDSRSVAWRGTFVNKNSLGRVLSLGAVAAVVLLVWSRRRRFEAGLALAAIAVVMMQTGSISSLAVTVVAAMAAVAIYRFPGWARAVPLASILIYLFGTVAVSGAAELAHYLGREATLTGRIPLWDLLSRYLAERPALGYGYSAFWQSQDGSIVSAISGWQVGQAHSGVLEMRLMLGWAGVTLMAAAIYAAGRFALTMSMRSGAWVSCLLLWLVLMDTVEATSTSGLGMLLLVSTLASVGTDERLVDCASS